jgi:hypothetical protein
METKAVGSGLLTATAKNRNTRMSILPFGYSFYGQSDPALTKVLSHIPDRVWDYTGSISLFSD